MTDQEYIASCQSMFGGDDCEIRGHTVKVVTVRKIQRCMCPACNGPDQGGHTIPSGARAVREHALVEGKWGSSYACLPCLASWWNHCGGSSLREYGEYCTESEKVTA
jgi:hypothetical protein